jgi:hypothetical protein
MLQTDLGVDQTMFVSSDISKYSLGMELSMDKGHPVSGIIVEFQGVQRSHSGAIGDVIVFTGEVIVVRTSDTGKYRVGQAQADRGIIILLIPDNGLGGSGKIYIAPFQQRDPLPIGSPSNEEREVWPTMSVEEREVFEALQRDCGSDDMPLGTVCQLVGARLTLVRQRFPSAPVKDLCEALLTYSPESALFAKGHSSSEEIPDDHGKKYQDELSYGSDQAFYTGTGVILGDDLPDSSAMECIVNEVKQQGASCGDRYNLWYVRYCAAVEQPNYNDKGQARTTNRGRPQLLDEGNGDMRLHDFTRRVNDALEHSGATNRVTDAQVLALRLYTTSTFRPLNNSLRWERPKTKGDPPIPFRACIQSARKCVLVMQAIKREPKGTYRGITGYLAENFKKDGMGMDFAFFSTTVDISVAEDFVGDTEHSVMFKVAYIRGCQGAEISTISIFPGEREVLFPPCTGFCLQEITHGDGDGSSGVITGHSAGSKVQVNVTPIAAH